MRQDQFAEKRREALSSGKFGQEPAVVAKHAFPRHRAGGDVPRRLVAGLPANRARGLPGAACARRAPDRGRAAAEAAAGPPGPVASKSGYTPDR